MGKSINKFIVKLSDLSNFRPKLMVSASPVKGKDKTFLIKLTHPNYKVGEDGKPIMVNGKKVVDVVYEEEFVSQKEGVIEGASEAIKYGKEVLLNRADIVEIANNTKYVEQLFIPQGRRGKVKLKTKESHEQELAEAKLAAEQAEQDLEMDSQMEMIDDSEEALEEVQESHKKEIKKGLKESKSQKFAKQEDVDVQLERKHKKAVKEKAPVVAKNKDKNKKVKKKVVVEKKKAAKEVKAKKKAPKKNKK